MKKDTSLKFIVDIDESSILNKMHIWDVYLNIVGNLQIKVDNNLILSDEVHPIVELAVSLQRWLKNGFVKGDSFEHCSLEDEEKTLWFRRVVNGYEIGSSIQSSTKANVVKEHDLISACELYIVYIETYLKQKGYVFQNYVMDERLASS